MPKCMKARGDRFTMGPVNLVALYTLQHGVWAAFQYFNIFPSCQILKFMCHYE